MKDKCIICSIWNQSALIYSCELSVCSEWVGQVEAQEVRKNVCLCVCVCFHVCVWVILTCLSVCPSPGCLYCFLFPFFFSDHFFPTASNNANNIIIIFMFISSLTCHSSLPFIHQMWSISFHFFHSNQTRNDTSFRQRVRCKQFRHFL